MSWIVGLLAMQAVSVPAYSPPTALPPAVPERLSLVIATTVSETDPKPLCGRPDCTSLFLGRYRGARTLAGPALPSEFSARIEMGSPWDRPYRLALIVEQRDGQEPLVRANMGFNLRTGQACFDAGTMRELAWAPEGAGVARTTAGVCVSDAGG